MKHDDDRVIDLKKVKAARQRKKKQLRALIIGTAVLVVLLIGWVIVVQAMEVVGPGDFWTNFAT